VRILAVSASDDAPELVDLLLERPWLDNVDRAFLFGGAAAAFARRAADEVGALDDRFLDDAAAHLLEDGPQPKRVPPDPRFARIVIVTNEDPAVFAPLTATSRALEIAGAALITAIPAGRALDDEELENAHLWIAGDLPARALDRGGRHVLGPGDLRGPRAALRVEIQGRGATAAWLRESGEIAERVPLDLALKSRLRMRG
jgi:hypothetical protein